MTDLGANGLHATDDAVDMFDGGEGILRLDGDWDAQNLSESDYLQAAEDADGQYARMLTALLERAR